MAGKIVAMILLSFALVACGSSSDNDVGSSGGGNEGQYADLEQFKGESQEPTLFDEGTFDIGTRDNEDLMEINSYLSSEVDSRHSTFIQYRALQDGKVALVLNSSTGDASLSLSGEGLDQSSFVFSGNDAIVFSAVIDGLYDISVTSGESDVTSFELKMVEANRSSLGLSDSEYWVNSTITDDYICDDREGSNTYTYGQIFNFEQGYVAYSDGIKVADFNVKDELNFSYIETYPKDDGSYTYNYDVELSLLEGEVIGSGPCHNFFGGV